MKKIILALFFVFTGFSIIETMQTIPLIYSTTVNATNDSFASDWINADYNDISVSLYVDDTMNMKYYIDFRMDTLRDSSFAIDSIYTISSASTGKTKAVILRGQGASSIINIIPTANQFRVRGIRGSGAEDTGKFVVQAYLR